MRTMAAVWPVVVDQVEQHASTYMNGGLRGISMGDTWPDFWDTRAFAFVLREAAGGFKPFAPLPKYRNPYIPKVLASKGEKVLNLLRDALLNWDSPRLPPLQALCGRLLLDNVYPDALYALVLRRALVLGYNKTDVPCYEILNAFVKKLPQSCLDHG